jgi:hypothetical protein
LSCATRARLSERAPGAARSTVPHWEGALRPHALDIYEPSELNNEVQPEDHGERHGRDPSAAAVQMVTSTTSPTTRPPNPCRPSSRSHRSTGMGRPPSGEGGGVSVPRSVPSRTSYSAPGRATARPPRVPRLGETFHPANPEVKRRIAVDDVATRQV